MRPLKKRDIFIALFVLIFIGGTVVFIIQELNPGSVEPSYNVTYGELLLPVYNSSDGVIQTKNFTGLLITINNIDDQNLSVVSVQNSTLSIPYPPTYVYTQVVAQNGSLVYAYQQSYEIYLGYQRVFIPADLSPGTYLLLFNNGNGIDFKVN